MGPGRRPDSDCRPAEAYLKKRRYEFDIRSLTVFFLVAMPLVTFGSFIVVSFARSTLRDSVGASLEQRALQTKLDIERSVSDQIVHLRLLAQDPTVCDALRAAETANLASAGAQRSVRHDPAPQSSPLSRRLRDVQRALPGFKFIQVVDGQGQLLAATARGGRTSSLETSWFRGLAEGTSEVYVGDIHRLPGSRLAVYEIAHSVFNPADGRWLGAVRVILDAMELYAVLAPVRVGHTGRAQLLRNSDGLILVSDETERVLRSTFPGFESLEAAIHLRRGFWQIPETQSYDSTGRVTETIGPRLVGQTMVDQIPGISWVVAVEQDLREATLPVEQLTRYLWIHFIGAFLSVILLSVYLSFRQETPVIAEALHIHEEHYPPSLEDQTPLTNDGDPPANPG